MANKIDKHPVPLILKKILNDRLSGELTVKGDNYSKSLFFVNGELEYGSSTLKEDRLGEMLYACGYISKEQLIMLRRMRDTSPNKFGKILVDHKIMTRAGLFEALREQIRHIAISTFLLKTGEWIFNTGVELVPGTQKFGIHLAEVIIDGCQAAENFLYYQHRFQFRAPVTLPIPEDIGQLLSSEEIKLYVKLTKYQSGSCKQIISYTRLPDHLFWKQASLFYMLSIIDFTEFRVDEELNEQIEMINDLHDKLTNQSIDHYELLELKNTASVHEVKDKYFSFTRRYHPDAVPAAPDSRTMEKTDFIMRQATQAFDTLSDKDKKKAYDTGKFMLQKMEREFMPPDEEELAEDIPENAGHEKSGALKRAGNPERVKPGDIKKNNSKKARALYLKAHSLYEQKRYREAVRLLEDAVILDNNRSSYFLLLGLSQTRVPSLRPYAEKNLQKVMEMEPWNADPLFYMGQLYWAENLFKKAEKCFRQALEINMEHTLAAKMIEKIEGKRKSRPLFSVFGDKKK